MFKIPEKFTGLNASLLSFSEVKALCYSLQGLELCSVKNITDYEYPNNYFRAKVKDSEGEFELIQNCFVKILAFKKIDSENIFLNKESIESAIHSLDSEINVLDSSQLSQKIQFEQLNGLSKLELKEVKYWLPASIGEMLFCSFFD